MLNVLYSVHSIRLSLALGISVITPYHIHNPSGTLANQSIQMDSTYQGVQMNDVRVTWQWSFSGPKVQSLNCESIHLNTISNTRSWF